MNFQQHRNDTQRNQVSSQSSEQAYTPLVGWHQDQWVLLAILGSKQLLPCWNDTQAREASNQQKMGTQPEIWGPGILASCLKIIINSCKLSRDLLHSSLLHPYTFLYLVLRRFWCLTLGEHVVMLPSSPQCFGGKFGLHFLIQFSKLFWF